MVTALALLTYPRIDPVILRFGPLAIRWYGVAYMAGFFAAYGLLHRMIRNGILKMPAPVLGDMVGTLALGVVIGGRLGWWLFYHRNMGVIEPWYEPIAIWHGGMSFHGGLIGVISMLVFWSRKNHFPFWNLADCLALVTPIGLFFGRIANFINAELVGRATDVPWAMIFPGDDIPRHPSQLYEAALEGPILLASLWLLRKILKPHEGQIAGYFIVLYGIFRFLVEFTREPDKQLGFIAMNWLTMGQLLSALLAAAGIGVIFVNRKSDEGNLPDAPSVRQSRSRP